jgi:uncharacterized protein with HEPN domain
LSRKDDARLGDIVESIEVTRANLTRGDLHDGLVYDAVRVRLIEIGEAVKSISPDLLADVPDVPWSEIARMRDHLAHRYFDTDHAIVGRGGPRAGSAACSGARAPPAERPGPGRGLTGTSPGTGLALHRDGGTPLKQPGTVPVRQMVSRLLALQLALHGAISGRFRHHPPDGAPLLTW